VTDAGSLGQPPFGVPEQPDVRAERVAIPNGHRPAHRQLLAVVVASEQRIYRNCLMSVDQSDGLWTNDVVCKSSTDSLRLDVGTRRICGSSEPARPTTVYAMSALCPLQSFAGAV
jgi:hypothetical protein